MSVIQRDPSRSASSSPLSWEEVEEEGFQMIAEDFSSSACSPRPPEMERPASTSSTQSQASSTCSQTPLMSQASTRSILSDSIPEQPSEESTDFANTNPEPNICLQAPIPRAPTPFPAEVGPVLRQRGISPKAQEAPPHLAITIDAGPILEVEEEQEYQNCMQIFLHQCRACFCKQKV